MPTALITGGHGGIGLVCSKTLASTYGLNLLLAGRSLDKMESVAQELRASFGVKVTTLLLDTSSLASVRAAAAECRRMLDSGEIDTLDVLLCNAGVRLAGYAYSSDGYEETFATNYLGHFLLVELLRDRMAERGRIVFTVSGTHDPDTMDGKLVGAAAEPDGMVLAELGKDGTKPLSTGQLYSTSKLCLMLLTYELDRRLRKAGSSLSSIAYDPGATPGTDFLRSMPRPVQCLSKTRFMSWVTKRIGVTIGSVEFSGEALAKIAADPAYANSTGKYLQSNDGSLNDTRSSKASYDTERARRLWDDSTKLVQPQP